MKTILKLLDKYNKKTETVLNHIVLFSDMSGELKNEENEIIFSFESLSELVEELKRLTN